MSVNLPYQTANMINNNKKSLYAKLAWKDVFMLSKNSKVKEKTLKFSIHKVIEPNYANLDPKYNL